MRQLGNFTTTLCIPTVLLPADYVRYVNERDHDEPPLGPNDEMPEVNVRVLYKEGWYDAGRCTGPIETSYPPDGEDPEIMAVEIVDDYGQVIDLVADLSEKLLQKLRDQAFDHQSGGDRDDEPDYGDEPDWDPN